MSRRVHDEDEIHSILFEESDDSDGETLDIVPIYQGSGDMPEKDARTREVGTSSESVSDASLSPIGFSPPTTCGTLSDSGADTPSFYNVRRKSIFSISGLIKLDLEEW